MRNSTSSATRILTVVSLVVLCTLSFAVVYGTQNIVDTPPQDSLFSFHKPDVPHHRRAIHHLRAQSSSNALSPTPSSTPSSTPNTDSHDSSTSSSKSTSTSQSSDTTTSTTSSTPTSSSYYLINPLLKRHNILSVDTTASSTSAISNLPLAERTSTISASSTGGAASKGFFENKAAVGVTFSIVGIICGLAAVMGIITVIRRYRRAHYRDDDFYEKYPRPAELGQGPLGESATDLTTGPAPADAYPDRAIHYGQPDPSTVFRPPTPTRPPPPAYENYDYDPNRPSSAASHPFADPANAPRAAPGAPPVTYPRSFQGRAQEVVTTDSYYGSNSAGVGAVGVGFAQ
ncbi:hypothetical protein EDB86DRAFT_2900179 [Lactarius hatsudake]|nr:hypothetical protein EDB86DRAFT_2900179 [Lactarius hatsudake]